MPYQCGKKPVAQLLTDDCVSLIKEMLWRPLCSVALAGFQNLVKTPRQCEPLDLPLWDNTRSLEREVGREI